MSDGFAETSFPPNERLLSVTFIEGEQSLLVELEDGGTFMIPSADILSIHGARIRRETVHTTTEKKSATLSGALGSMAMTGAALAAGLPVRIKLKGSQEQIVTTKTEELQYVFGIRVKDHKELWYLRANSFNFRKALGEDAAYSLEMNARAFVNKLGNFCQTATCDEFFNAALTTPLPLTKTRLPKPVESLLEFIRSTV